MRGQLQKGGPAIDWYTIHQRLPKLLAATASRCMEQRELVKRLLTITKMRDTHFDIGMRELQISSSGMWIAGLLAPDGDIIPSAVPVELPQKPSPTLPVGGDEQKS